VEINKTLSANQDGDAIGGSVNLRTKTAGELPTLTIEGIGGYTPIIGGRYTDQFDATVGQRFGAKKKFGILLGGSYDYNGRGIDDIEPVGLRGRAEQELRGREPFDDVQSARSSPANGQSCPSQRVPKYSGPDRINSNPIDIHQRGRLPSSRCI
jgi:outer membrane receptor protein involved in Fe transport